MQDFREKNTDHMRPDIVALLKSSKNAFVCGLMGIDPTATFRWAVLRAYFRALVAFREAGRRRKQKKAGEGNDGMTNGSLVTVLWNLVFGGRGLIRKRRHDSFSCREAGLVAEHWGFSFQSALTRGPDSSSPPAAAVASPLRRCVSVVVVVQRVCVVPVALLLICSGFCRPLQQ